MVLFTGAARVRLFVRAWLFEWRVAVCACCAPCFVWGVLLRALWRVCSIVCLSVAPCSIACCWFVTVCVACRLLWRCVIRECARADCDVVHAGLCECAFDGDLGCRLFFTV